MAISIILFFECVCVLAHPTDVSDDDRVAGVDDVAADSQDRSEASGRENLHVDAVCGRRRCEMPSHLLPLAQALTRHDDRRRKCKS